MELKHFYESSPNTHCTKVYCRKAADDENLNRAGKWIAEEKKGFYIILLQHDRQNAPSR